MKTRDTRKIWMDGNFEKEKCRPEENMRHTGKLWGTDQKRKRQKPAKAKTHSYTLSSLHVVHCIQMLNIYIMY